MTGREPRIGDIVNITIRGARLGDRMKMVNGDEKIRIILPSSRTEYLSINPAITIEPAMPRSWPPRKGDLWRDRDGELWFGMQDDHPDSPNPLAIELAPATGGCSWGADGVNREHGPLALVRREDEG